MPYVSLSPYMSLLSLSRPSLSRLLHSFPTRRSSDLQPRVPLLRERLLDGLRRRGPEPDRAVHLPGARRRRDRKSTRLNSSHVASSYAVFCLKKQKIINKNNRLDNASTCTRHVIASEE